MKKLLSLPPNLVEFFYDIEKADRDEWFCTSDPIGSKLGSGERLGCLRHANNILRPIKTFWNG